MNWHWKGGVFSRFSGLSHVALSRGELWAVTGRGGSEGQRSAAPRAFRNPRRDPPNPQDMMSSKSARVRSRNGSTAMQHLGFRREVKHSSASVLS